MTETALISLRDVFCLHRTPEGDVAALQGATLDVPAGEFLCVLGPSGAGKSTLLRVVAGLQTPAAGDVLVGSQDIGRMPERARMGLRHTRMGFVSQRADSVLTAELRAAEAVALPLALRGVPSKQRRHRVDELLELTGLRACARSRTTELSGGERQRLALCAAVAHRPSLLLADEPTAELDSASAEAVLQTIAELVRGHGLTAIVVSHDAATARAAQRTVQIRDGRIAEEGRTGERALVVGRGGWVQLPESLLNQAGIGERVHAVADEGQVILVSAGARPIDGHAADPPVEPRFVPVAEATDRWSPAEVVARSVSCTVGRGSTRRTVLDGVEFVFPPGRLSVITGPSGAGKTTLLRLLTGLERTDAGAVLIDGQDLGRFDEEDVAALRRERIGYLPQDPLPVGFLSAGENVSLALRLRGFPPTVAAERARASLHAVGLGDRTRQRVERLSVGEAQRVALARAAAGSRGLLVVDEPTSRLDRARARIVAGLLALAARDGQTVVCATHDPELIERAEARLEL